MNLERSAHTQSIIRYLPDAGLLSSAICLPLKQAVLTREGDGWREKPKLGQAMIVRAALQGCLLPLEITGAFYFLHAVIRGGPITN